MDWLLALLALTNLYCAYLTLQPRNVKRKGIPWSIFAVSLLSTELAWFWLPLQFLLALSLCLAGGLETLLGKFALLILVLGWLPLVMHIVQSRRSGKIMENALRSTLGENYRDAIPEERAGMLRESPSFHDWKLPFNWRRSGVEVLKDIPYGPAGMRQQLDIYRPATLPASPCPVLLQIHGGAWVMSRKEDQAQPLMWHLASRGWICVAVNYRLSPSVGFPTHIEDCKRALCWIRENAQDYAMDGSFIAVTGGSAGGHLAALMALSANNPDLQQDNPDTDTSLQAAVPLYGLYDMASRHQQYRFPEPLKQFLTGRVMHESETSNPALWDLASPISQIRNDAPPFFILHGTQDSLIPVRDAQVFSERLRAVSTAPVVYAELPFAEHGFDLFRSQRAEFTVDAVHRFLEWCLAREKNGDTAEAGIE